MGSKGIKVIILDDSGMKMRPPKDPEKYKEETYQAGDAFYMPPGHVPTAETGTEFLQFSPTDQLAETLAAIKANAAAMHPAHSRPLRSAPPSGT